MTRFEVATFGKLLTPRLPIKRTDELMDDLNWCGFNSSAITIILVDWRSCFHGINPTEPHDTVIVVDIILGNYNGTV